VVTETNHTNASKTHLPKATLPWTKKMLIAGLLCLEIPFGLVFFPLAAVLVLTGVLAPLGIMSFAIATRPFSWAMKSRTAWRKFALTQQVPGSTPGRRERLAPIAPEPLFPRDEGHVSLQDLTDIAPTQ